MNESISLVIVILQGKAKLARCLQAIQAQDGPPPVEIVVPFDDTFPDLPALQAGYPAVQFVPLHGRRTYAELRTAGIKQTHGDIVAITEDHCIPAPGWLAAIRRAHQQPHAAVGGPVDKYRPDTAVNWALYFADYVRYALPLPAGPSHNLTDCNVTYKRAALDAIAPSWQTEFHEPEVHAALQARGESLWFDPEVRVLQQRDMPLGAALRDRFAFGRLFGSRRAMAAPLSRRLVFLASSLVLPLLLVARVVGHVRARRRYAAELLPALPAVILLNTTWAFGEFVGYLTGRAGTLEVTPK